MHIQRHWKSGPMTKWRLRADNSIKCYFSAKPKTTEENEWKIRRSTKEPAKLRWPWVGQIVRRTDGRWIWKVLEWRPKDVGQATLKADWRSGESCGNHMDANSARPVIMASFYLECNSLMSWLACSNAARSLFSWASVARNVRVTCSPPVSVSFKIFWRRETSSSSDVRFSSKSVTK